MLRFADISNHQASAGLRLYQIAGELDALAVKATEGTGFVDGSCDGYFQQAKQYGLKRAFYHFAGTGDPEDEARFFIDNTHNYFGDAVPVLDWEGDQSVSWVNAFVRYIYGHTGVWPWIYANPWRFNLGGVEANCMRWVASYPSVSHPTFEQAERWTCPTADGTVGAWQFCSDGRLGTYAGDLDLNLFYGDADAWDRYVGAPDAAVKVYTLSDDGIEVTVNISE